MGLCLMSFVVVSAGQEHLCLDRSDFLRKKLYHYTPDVVIMKVLPLSTTDRMFLALGCARGLRALHAYSADLCHRDIKSSNFLVDGQLNAKICDLELGGTKNHSLDIKKVGPDYYQRILNAIICLYPFSLPGWYTMHLAGTRSDAR